MVPGGAGLGLTEHLHFRLLQVWWIFSWLTLCIFGQKASFPQKNLVRPRSLSMLSSQSENHVKALYVPVFSRFRLHPSLHLEQAHKTRKSFTRPKFCVLILGWFLATCAGFAPCLRLVALSDLAWMIFGSRQRDVSVHTGNRHLSRTVFHAHPSMAREVLQ